jgi:predicted DNA-binding protein
MSVQMIIRVDPVLKDRANRLAIIEGKNLSQVVRELLEKYTQDRDAQAYIDTLWDDIGRTFTQSGVTEDDIGDAIKQVRQKHG